MDSVSLKKMGDFHLFGGALGVLAWREDDFLSHGL